MARAIWSGSIAFGLVNVPVKLFTATESHRVAFHELDSKSGQRIHNKRVTAKSGHEVAWEDIEKGFEVGKGRYVILSNEELAAAAPEKTRAIEIEQFVSLGDIDPVSWDQTYFVAPDGAAAAKAYALLRTAMEERKRVGIGRFVMRTKEYLVCIRPFADGFLALETMFFPDEVRDVAAVGGPLPKAAPKAARQGRELEMAERLIDMLTAPWDPRKYKDTFTARVMELVRKKEKGEAITAPEPLEERDQVVDLMDALKATLARGAGQGAGRDAGRASPGAKRAAAAARVRSPATRVPKHAPKRMPGNSSHTPARAEGSRRGAPAHRGRAASSRSAKRRT
jgi:DNA end-binding protein Ku